MTELAELLPAGTAIPAREAGVGFPAPSVPFPTVLLDAVMPRLTDTEWRLLCVVVRQTLGWRAEGGGRKERDWLTQGQLTTRTGRSTRPLSGAIDHLVKRGLIEVLTDEGRALPTPQERRRYGGRHWFRLGAGLTARWEAESGSSARADAESTRAFTGRDSARGRLSPANVLSAVGKVHTTKQSHDKKEGCHESGSSGTGSLEDPVPEVGQRRGKSTRAHIAPGRAGRGDAEGQAGRNGSVLLIHGPGDLRARQRWEEQAAGHRWAWRGDVERWERSV